MLASTLVALTMSTLPPAEVERLVARADEGDTRAMQTLARARSRPAARALCAGLEGRAASEPATASRLEVIAAAPDPKCAKPVSAWLAGASPKDHPVAQRSLRAAARYFAAVAPVGPGVAALAALSGHAEPTVADAAIAAFAAHDALDAGPYVARWTESLRAGRSAHVHAALKLLARARAKGAVGAIVKAGLGHAEMNPIRGAPEHVAALRAITGEDRGPKITDWR